MFVYGKSTPDVAGETGRWLNAGAGETARDVGLRGAGEIALRFDGPIRDAGLLSSDGRFIAEYGR